MFDGLKLRYTEKDKPHPLNYYAKTKLVMEYVLSTLDMNYMIARTAVLYGIGGSGKVSFPTWILDKLKKKEKVNALTDQKNNPTFVDSLCEFLFRLYQKDEVGTFHITGNECISRYDFAKKVAETFELDEGLIAPLTSPELNQIAPRPASVNMISEKAERAASIRTLSVDEGLELFKRQLAI